MPTSGGVRPAGNCQRDEGDASYARYGYGCAGKVLAQQQLTDERRDNQQRQSGGSFGDSSEMSTFFIALTSPMFALAARWRLEGARASLRRPVPVRA